LLLAVTGLFGQEKKDSKKMDLFDFTLPDKKDVSLTPQSAQMAFESTVKPEYYYVGPGDIIDVSIWMSPPQNYLLPVTPEGTLIIPTVGEVSVTDMTLAKAKEKILLEVRKKYLNVGITATLAKPRQVVVLVSGHVVNPGSLTMSAAERVHRAVDEANRPSRTQTADDVTPVVTTMSSRNILVRHKDGSSSRVDIKKYFVTHHDDLDPYLREGDVIVVPKRDPYKNAVVLYGQFNTNGRIEYVPGDSLTDAVQLANGLATNVAPEQAVFSRMNEDGSTITNSTIDLAAILEGREANIALQPGDRIILNAKQDARADYNVDVRGEVKYPGTYPITRNSTRLSEIIRNAGGFTDMASIENAEVQRSTYLPEQTKESEKEGLLSLRGGRSSSDSTGYEVESILRLRQEAVSVDFQKLFVEKDTTQDVVLQREDQIVVPSRRQTLYVFGQVVNPGHVPYIEGRDVSYYVKRAGGFADHASRGEIKVIKARTKQWLHPGDTKLEEGDNIWIPAEQDHPFSYYMTIASQFATVISVVIGLAVIIVQLRK
jgi:polysaccharide export outer membrane protein